MKKIKQIIKAPPKEHKIRSPKPKMGRRESGKLHDFGKGELKKHTKRSIKIKW